MTEQGTGQTGARAVTTFHAITTRDAVALKRDGQEIVDAVYVSDDPRDGALYEVTFADGYVMLASLRDLDL